MATRQDSNDKPERTDTRPSRPRRRGFGFFKVLLAVALVIFLCATFPRRWGPRVVRWAVLRFAPVGDPAKTSLVVHRVSPFGLDISDIRLGGLPTAPSCKSLSIRYTLGGLFFSEIDSILLDGVSFQADYSPAPPEKGHQEVSFGKEVRYVPGAPKTPFDLFKGFSIADFKIKNVSGDFSPLLPPKARSVLRDGRFHGEFEGCCENTWQRIFHGKWTGTFSGGPVEGGLDYLPPYVSSTSNAVVKASLAVCPVLSDEIPPLPGPLVLQGEAGLYKGKGLEADCKGAACCSNTAWRIEAEAHRDALGFQAEVKLPKTVVTQNDGLVSSAFAFAPPSAVAPLASLEFQAALAATMSVTGVTGRLPEWQVHGRLSDCALSTYLGGKPVCVTGLVARVGCYGIGNRLAPLPIGLSVTNASIGPFPFGRGRFQVIADRKMLMMTSGILNFCGGKIRAYSLYLTFDNLRSGFTLFLDQLDVDKIAKLLPGVGGSGRGRLYGRIPLRVTAKHELRLRNAFLYARPGETGNISFKDTGPIVSKLREYGIQADYCDTIGFALHNLDYDLLRFDLTRPRNEDGSLSIRLQGQAMDGKKPTPVTLNVNLNGPIEKLLNLGIKTATISR